MRYVLESALLWIMGTLFRALPRGAALAFGRQLGSLAFILAFRRRQLALRNLELALGDEIQSQERMNIARRSFKHLGTLLPEFFQIPRLTPDSVSDIMTFEGEEYLDAALAQGKGVFVLSAHMGNWDLMGAAFALRGYPLALITKTSRSEAINRIWMQYRADKGVKLLKGRGTIKESLKHLKDGGMVGFALDQNARRTEGVFVPFFGREACTLTSLALLARRTGSPVVPIHTIRTGKGHHIVIEKPIEHNPQPEQDQDIIERTREYTQWVEKVVRLHPDQWTWLHNRWKTRPKGESRVQSPESRE
jgi:KDO2-lipid IV(A) lauroyltransferase